MTAGPRRPAANLVALAVLALAMFWGVAGALPGLASAAPGSADRPLAPTAAPGQAARPAPAAPSRGPRLELRVASMSPRVVTSTGPPTLTLTGELVNTGDQMVRDVEIRAQRGDRLRTEGDVRTALAGNAANDAVTPAFSEVTDTLEPGSQVPVQLNMPLRGSAGGSLALQRAGVYELLINVNGIPDSGGQARLAGVRMLLPVLGLPSVPDLPAEPAVEDATGGPTPVSMLYPLADQPRRLPTGPGEPVLLGDDQLAAELSQGGRLDGLLSALETGAPAGSPVRDAICLAVDPDLLRTVQDMSGGYRVRAPDGQETDGIGAAAAGRWLDRLRAVAAGRCVVPLPYADADLVALSRAGLDDLASYATRDGARITADILRTPVRTDTTWPADGLLDERSLTDYVRGGGREVVLSADAVAVNGRSSRSTTGGLVALPAGGAEAAGLLTDPLVTLAARGEDADQNAKGAYSGDVGADSSSRGLGSLAGSTSASPSGTGIPLADQDAIGATAFRALNGPSTVSSSAATATPLLVAPPHRWNTTATDAGSLLGTIGTLIAAGRLTPTPLPGTPAGAQPAVGATAPLPLAGQNGEPPNATLVYPLRAGAREVPGTITAELRTDRDAANDLRSAAESEPGVGATPAQVFDPVTEGLLRAGSAVWRGNPELADLSTAVITARVALLRSLVRVLEPPSPYALGDKEAPLPITLANGLPVAMRVRVALSDTPGLRTETIGEQRIPPMGRLQLRVNAQLTRSGQFSVEARLTTLAGSPLGVPSRLLLRSTAYGTITLWLTGTAGLLLVILAVRRIARRLRGAASTRRTEAGPAPSAIPDRSRPPAGAVPRRPPATRAPPDGRPTPPGSRAIGPNKQPVRPGSRAGQARTGQTGSTGQPAPRVSRTSGTSSTGGTGTRFPPAGDMPGRTSPPPGYPQPPPPLPPTAPLNQPRAPQPGGRTVGRPAARPPGQPVPSGPPASPARTSAPAARPGQPGPQVRPMPNGTPPGGRTKPPTGQPGSQGNQAGGLPADQPEPTAQNNPTRPANPTGPASNATGRSKPAGSVGPIRPGNSISPTANPTGPRSPVDRPATPPTRPTRPTPTSAPATTPTNPRVPRP